MRYLIILVLSILSIQLSHAQINEIGVFVGGSNFIGDVGATNYIAPNQSSNWSYYINGIEVQDIRIEYP